MRIHWHIIPQMSFNVSADEEGKPVIDSNGQSIATVVRVDDGIPYVDPESDFDSTARLALGWEGATGQCRLLPAHIDTVTDSGIYLKANL